VALGALLLAGGLSMARGPEQDKREEEAKQCLKQVKEELSRLKGDRAKVEAVTKAPLDRVFPNTTFCSVLFRRYPVAIAPPESLTPSSLFAVPHAADDKPHAVTNTDRLEEYFKSKSRPIRNTDDAKDVLRAWLELAQVFEQDGYYKFEVLEDSLKVTTAADDERKASGRVIVTAGGNGEITATLTFDASGKLTKVEHSAKLKPGPRPRCQATKLLDADPIVRGMAEDALLYMGPAAKDYLDEQRARATPELQAAIDRIWLRICEER
jgi:hypothetical protein